MRIYFANTLLASADLALGRAGPLGLAINGSQVNDPAQFFRADAETYFPRGRATEVSFSVGRQFSTYAAAQLGAALTFAQLPKQGDLQLFDDAGNGLAKLANAVVGEVGVAEIRGIGFVLRYQFLGGVFTTDDISIPDESDLVKRDTVALDEDDESKAIAFATPFASRPHVTLTLLIPSGGGVFDVSIDDTTLDENGFTARFGAAVPGAGYKLSYIAIL